MAMKKKTEEQDITTVDVGRETLDATPGRLLMFLRGVGMRPAILATLAEVGYSDQEHSRGWDLLHGCSGFVSPSEARPVVNGKVVGAIAALDKQDERIHTLVDASLKHRAPRAREALLEGLSPGTGAESVVYFKALLGRVHALDKGKLEGVPAAEAKLAMEVLEKRGLSGEQRATFAALVEEAESLGAPSSPDTAAAEREAMDEKLRRARAFFEEWSEIARTEIKRRDHLIFLGLASRRAPREESEAPVTAPAPTAAAPAAVPAVVTGATPAAPATARTPT